MSHKYERLLEGILHEPVSGNIHWREVESLLQHLGASISTTSGARVHVILNNVEGHIHRPHHSGICTKQEIRHLRDYLVACGVTSASNTGEAH